MTAQAGPPNQKQLSLVAGANVTLSQSASGGSATITIIGGGTGATGTGVNFSAGTQSVGSGTMVFANSNSISFGMSGSSQITATIAFPAFGSQSIGASNLGNLSGTSGVASGSVAQFLFAGGNNITLSQSLNGASATLSIIGTQTVQTQNRFNATISGNTSGTLAAISSGTLTFVGGNNITLSQVGNSIVISAPTPGGLQTAVSGLSAGTTSITSGTVSFANSNGVSFGINGQTITASAAGGNQASVGGNTSGTLTLISSGTLTLAGGNNITLSQVGNAITISAPNTSAQSVQTQSNIQAIIPLGNTAGTTGTVQTGSLGIAGGANITISQSSGANSTNLTIIGAAGVPSILAIGNTTGSTSVGGGSIVLAGGNNVTLSGSTAAGGMTLTISVPNTSGQTVQTQNLVDISLSTAAGGSTAGTMALISSGTMTLAAGSNITLSQAGNAVTILGASGGAGGGGGAIQLSAGAGSTSGTTALMTGTMTAAAGNGITLSQAGGNAFTIQAAAAGTQVNVVGSANAVGTNVTAFAPIDHVHGGVGPIGVSTFGNTTGNTAMFYGQMVMVGGNAITLSQQTNASHQMTVTISAQGGTNQLWTPYWGQFTGNAQVGQSSVVFLPAAQAGYLTASQINAYVSGSVSTSSNSSHGGTLSVFMGLYTRSGSTLSQASSGSVSYTWNVTSSTSMDSLSGLRQITVPMNIAMTPGDYWIAFMSQTASVGTNWVTLSNGLLNGARVTAAFAAASNATVQMMPGHGRYSAATAALPVSARLNQIICDVNIANEPLMLNFVNITN